MNQRRVLLLCACIVIAAMVPLAFWLRHRPRIRYDVMFLPDVNGVSFSPSAINDQGRIFGKVQIDAQRSRLYLWDPNHGMQDLGVCVDLRRLGPLHVNNAGQVAWAIMDPNGSGYACLIDPNGEQHVFRPPGGEEIHVNDLNNRGQIVGYLCGNGKPRRAFVWSKATGMQDLPIPDAAESMATGINDLGQIVGYFAVGSLDWRAFVYDPNLGVRELGFRRSGSDAQCLINDQGLVVGQFNSSQSGPGVSTWTARTGSQPLPWKGQGSLQVRGLNDTGYYLVNVSREGIRVGRREFRRRSECHLWESGRCVRQLAVRLCCGDDLRHRNVKAVSGWDINKDGTILGVMTVKGSGLWHAVILEPMK